MKIYKSQPKPLNSRLKWNIFGDFTRKLLHETGDGILNATNHLTRSPRAIRLKEIA